jgi:hypothetical protein
VLAALAIFLWGGSFEAAVAKSTPGATLHRACNGTAIQACLAYVAGVVDLHEEALAPQTGRMFCPPENMDYEDVAQGIWRWFDENRDFHALPAVFGVTKALGLMYPCE